METFEHKKAGDQIRIEKTDNPYLIGSNDLSPYPENNLQIRMMQFQDGVPVPMDLTLTAGDIVAMAGDYYTSAGWAKRLQLPERTGDVVDENERLFHQPVENTENEAFLAAYSDLASPTVKKSDIDRIYAIEKRTYIPSFTTLNSYAQQIAYTRAVKDYGKKLTENEAHFAPWSARAYIIGHHTALQMANMAYYCDQLADGKIENEDDERLPETLRDALKKIRKNPESFKLKDKIEDNQSLYKELANRYHALAIAQDLFAMHFYSDHFAGGHMSRIGRLREIMPQKFGVWGSILINNQHNEDNTNGVTVTDPFQPESYREVENKPFRMLREDDSAYGDGTYLKRGNDANADMLINGMDNSLGDIYIARTKGEIRESQNYGGLAFLPEIDYKKRQNQPLLIHGTDGEVYYRSDVSRIQVLSPREYQETLKNPQAHGYEKLTYWRAFWLTIQLRVLGFIYSPKVVKHDEARESKIQQDEQTFDSKTSPSHEPAQKQSFEEEEVGAWRNTPPSGNVHHSGSLFGQESELPPTDPTEQPSDFRPKQ